MEEKIQCKWPPLYGDQGKAYLAVFADTATVDGAQPEAIGGARFEGDPSVSREIGQSVRLDHRIVEHRAIPLVVRDVAADGVRQRLDDAHGVPLLAGIHRVVGGGGGVRGV